MDTLNQYRVFVQIAEMGSFIKAAHALDLPRASVSAAIQQLERDMATRLFHRTTREVHLTADGTQLLERVRPLLADAEEISQLFQTRQRQVAGRLNVDVPTRHRQQRRKLYRLLPGRPRTHPGSPLRRTAPVGFRRPGRGHGVIPRRLHGGVCNLPAPPATIQALDCIHRLV